MLAFVKKLDNKLINMYTKLHHFQDFLSLRTCAAIYHNFYITLAIFSFRILAKHTLKRIKHVFHKFHLEL